MARGGRFVVKRENDKKLFETRFRPPLPRWHPFDPRRQSRWSGWGILCVPTTCASSRADIWLRLVCGRGEARIVLSVGERGDGNGNSISGLVLSSTVSKSKSGNDGKLRRKRAIASNLDVIGRDVTSTRYDTFCWLLTGANFLLSFRRRWIERWNYLDESGWWPEVLFRWGETWQINMDPVIRNKKLSFFVIYQS